jgi:mannan endo-1,4-beta-mannosidase
MKKIILLVLVACFIISCGKFEFQQLETLPITDFDTNHNAKKEQIIAYLNRIAETDSLIVGQNIGHADGSLNYGHFNNLIKTPGVLGFDLGYDDYNRDYSELINYIEDFYNQNGIVTVSFHMPNPHNRKDVKNKAKFDYNLLYEDGNSTNDNFKIILNNIGNFLQTLKNKNIVVIVRVFPEVNGGWFWWGNDNNWATQQQFKDLWIYTHEYLTIDRQLDNLLFAYCVNYQYSEEQKSVDYFYPGDDYVDIVGMDYYQNSLDNINENNSLSILSQYDKPLVMCEVGPAESDGGFDNLTYLGLFDYPKISYFVAWHSWEKNKWAIEDNLNADELMNNEKIITLDKINY